MTRLLWCAVGALALQIGLVAWLDRETETASRRDLAQCHERAGHRAHPLV
ncbi:MAG TPA: hypothetical protein VHW92_00120 [Mycobacteriales bacterium]|jgi:hypothetical protein|nr:hypothetical protein [Mycobacteriales bacterium]